MCFLFLYHKLETLSRVGDIIEGEGKDKTNGLWDITVETNDAPQQLHHLMSQEWSMEIMMLIFQCKFISDLPCSIVAVFFHLDAKQYACF